MKQFFFNRNCRYCRTGTYVWKACGIVCSGRASCFWPCESSWCCNPECCSGSSCSPGRPPCQKLCCCCTSRPCSACLCSAESPWTDGRSARENISPSVQSLREDVRCFFLIAFLCDDESDPYIYLPVFLSHPYITALSGLWRQLSSEHMLPINSWRWQML